MKPIIGILTEVDLDKNTRVLFPYVKAIERSGGVPIVLPYAEGEGTRESFIAMCDGFLFAGGSDINPERYGDEVRNIFGELMLHRDEMDFDMFTRAFEAKKPILAICRGAQLANAALGGKLYQDIPTEIPSDIQHRQVEAKNAHSHYANLAEGTPLRSLMGRERIRINSFHHQALKTLGKGLLPMATADDGLVEAIYYDGEQYLVGYQWHPERLYDSDDYHRLIFDDFIAVCKNERKKQ